MIGSVIIWIGLLSAIASAVSYYQAASGGNSSGNFARIAFRLSVASVALASMLLMMMILKHQFQYSYIWSYSSRDLPLYLLITAFWAGQEGSFLLWALFSSLIGLFLLSFSRHRKIEFETMSLFAFLQVFLLLLVAVKSPFELIWNAHPEQFSAGQIPADGRGLNPLLQNMWMAIHPPVLFIGFAAMAVPFVFAVAALWRRLYSEWLSLALPWVIFSALSLGAGIMLGGYWAYGVLGWGGWWGWDPVENSSLIPWVVSVILLHTAVAQKKTGKFVRTNFALAIVGFVLVIYSTFLTRSGILGESSVHSFVDPGAIAYTLLIVWLGTVALVGFRYLKLRWNEISPIKQDEGLFNRESFIGLAALVMGLSALVIFFGTSLPIVSQTTVEPSFYNNANLPLAVVMSILLALSLILRWNETPMPDFLRRLWIPLGSAVIASALLFYFGVSDLKMLALSLASFFVFAVNIDRGYRTLKESPRFVGGAVAHIGLALLFLGIIGSGFYGEKETASLVKGKTKEILGYQVTYLESQLTQDGKSKYLVQAETKGEKVMLEPVMFQSNFNKSVMRNPDYASFWTKDFYIEPISIEQSDNGAEHSHDLIRLEKNVATKVGDMQIKFLRFDMSAHGSEQMMQGGGMAIGAVLEVKKGKTTEVLTPVTVYTGGKATEGKPAMMKTGGIGFRLVNMNIDMATKKSTIDLMAVGLGNTEPAFVPEEMLVVEVSLKPFMSLVWIGAFLMMAGFFVAMINRGNEAKGSSPIPGNGRSKRRMARSVVTQNQEALEEAKT